MQRKFYFVAGEQVMAATSSTLLDAWLSLKLKTKDRWASEYRTLPITATDADGKELVTRSFTQWDDAVLEDTYGANYREILDNAASLV